MKKNKKTPRRPRIIRVKKSAEKTESGDQLKKAKEEDSTQYTAENFDPLDPRP